MATFDRYAALYDGFYRNRDYGREVELVASLVDREPGREKSVLDLGCGTGGHLERFLHRQFRATGVEQSPSMLAEARRRLQGRDVELVLGDARTVRLGARFGAVIALFHVLSYQLADDDVLALLRTAAEHARGPVVVDFWYGPGVLSQGLERREARFEDATQRVTRTATPTHDAVRRLVDVRYDFSIEQRSGEREAFSETHRMRYFFDDEIRRFAEAAGLDRIELGTLRGSAPTADDFAAHLIGRAPR